MEEVKTIETEVELVNEKMENMEEHALESNIANLSIEKTNVDDEKAAEEEVKPTEMLTSEAGEKVEISNEKQNNVTTDTQPPKTDDEVFVKPVLNTIALNMLSQYSSSEEDASSSSSEDESSEDEVPNKEYRNRCSSTDEESVCSEAPSEVSAVMDVDAEKKFLDDMESDVLEDDDNPKLRLPLKVKGEFTIDDLPPIEHLHISVPSNQCVVLGKIKSIVDQLVLVDSIPGTVLLNLDTILFLKEGNETLGKVFDVIGQVSDPLYCVRFNSNTEIQEKGIEIGMPVYCAPQTEYTSYIILSDVMKYTGSDASWKNDIEPPERYMDYSDDEQERSARKCRKGYNQDMLPPNDDDTAKRSKATSSRGRYNNRRNFNPHFNNGPQNMPHQNRNRPNNRFQRQPQNYGHSWHNNFQQNPPQSGPSYINPYAISQNIFGQPPPPPPSS